MKREVAVGTLVGVRDGPFIVIDTAAGQKKFPLHCELTVEWTYAHMGKRVMCIVEDGKVTQVT